MQNAYSVLTRDDEAMLDEVTGEAEVQTIAEEVSATPAQVALAWLLHRSPHTLLVPGTSSTEHLDSSPPRTAST